MADKPIQMADIYVGEKTLPNPTGIKPQQDTDTPPDKTRMSGGAAMHTEGGNSAKMDTSNPERADFIPRVHPIEKHFQRSGPRHQLGSKVPAPVTVSEN